MSLTWYCYPKLRPLLPLKSLFACIHETVDETFFLVRFVTKYFQSPYPGPRDKVTFDCLPTTRNLLFWWFYFVGLENWQKRLSNNFGPTPVGHDLWIVDCGWKCWSSDPTGHSGHVAAVRALAPGIISAEWGCLVIWPADLGTHLNLSSFFFMLLRMVRPFPTRGG